MQTRTQHQTRTPNAGALVLRFCTLDAANFAAARKDLRTQH